MPIKYILDVDGTLTPSRGIINNQFLKFMVEFADKNDIYLVTGSDREKTVEQVTEMLYNKAKYVFQCNGNDIWIKDKRIAFNDLTIDNTLRQDLHKELKKSKFPLRVGNHIEERDGLVNFSVVGRNADKDQRQQYIDFDINNNERIEIAERLSVNHLGYDIAVAGDIGLDITSKGNNKSQIIDYFDNDDTLYFFGDKTQEGGNDYEIARTISNRSNGLVFDIESWRQTWRILKA